MAMYSGRATDAARLARFRKTLAASAIDIGDEPRTHLRFHSSCRSMSSPHYHAVCTHVLEFREPTPPIKQFGVSIEVWEIFKCSQKLSFGRAICHPASGYVQGVNDLATPLLVVFLSEHLEGDLDSWVLTTLSPEITDQVG
ncbi:unnamed protein product [Sphagnum tenellum]